MVFGYSMTDSPFHYASSVRFIAYYLERDVVASRLRASFVEARIGLADHVPETQFSFHLRQKRCWSA
jgi:hypothetical protein